MDSLTKREREVALLVAERLSNREIAEKLCIAVKTVENHLTSIYGKLEIKSRAQLTRLVLETESNKEQNREEQR